MFVVPCLAFGPPKPGQSGFVAEKALNILKACQVTGGDEGNRGFGLSGQEQDSTRPAGCGKFCLVLTRRRRSFTV